MKTRLSFLLIFVATFAQAQLSENFSGVTLTPFNTTVETLNIGGMPTGWTESAKHTNALFLPHMGYFTGHGWVTKLYKLNNSAPIDTVAVSTSAYPNSPNANNWMITKQFTVPAATGNDQVFLTWESKAESLYDPEAYDVKISTTTNTDTSSFAINLYSKADEEGDKFHLNNVNLTPYQGQQVYIAFRHRGVGWMLLLDDIQTRKVTGIDANLTSLDIKRYEKINQNVTINGTILNEGKTINSMTIEWNDGGVAHDYTLTGLNILPFTSYNFTHTLPFTNSAANEFTLTVKIKNINTTGVDLTPLNNVKTSRVSLVASNATRNVVLEEATGSWCGWCPRGEVAIRKIDSTITDNSFIAIAVHTQSNDPMTVPEYEAGVECPAKPTCNVDRSPSMRSIDIMPTTVMNYYNFRRTVACPATVSQTLSYNSTSRAVTINAKAEFKTKITSDLRFASIIVEDSVRGTGSGYDQANSYGNNANGPMGGFENLPTVIPAAQRAYNHVGRALVGGYYGIASSLPASVNSTTPNTYTLNYTLPTTIDAYHVKVVTLLVDNASGEILNAVRTKLVSPTSLFTTTAPSIDFQIYPVPANKHNLNIKFDSKTTEEYTAEIYTIDGRKVWSKSLGKLSGHQDISLQSGLILANGEYLLLLNTKEATSAKHFTITD